MKRRWHHFVAWIFSRLGIVRLCEICELDEETGLMFKISPGGYFWVVSLGGRDYYIETATGKYDGWGQATNCSVEEFGEEQMP